ncbi:MAG: ABC transporter substrate-binding protein [Phenylobacterium sp.]|nr:ABC transporter substrate-binding protein [Phenylobacterium sp.]
MLAAWPVAAAPRVFSLDQCADQYVLALSPREAIVGLSTRADDADSRLREQARGLPLRRTTLESVLAARPDVVVRHWGGDEKLLAALRRRGIAVVEAPEATSFDDVRLSLREIGAALGQPARAEALVREMDDRLARAGGAWGGARALYLPPGGATAGKGTLIGAMLEAAGLTPAASRPGYSTVSLEALVMRPPAAVVLGFFDTFMLANANWGPGRHQALRRTVKDRTIASLPGEVIGCPGWFVAEAAETLAARAPK